jgi:hypothetical protein
MLLPQSTTQPTATQEVLRTTPPLLLVSQLPRQLDVTRSYFSQTEQVERFCGKVDTLMAPAGRLGLKRAGSGPHFLWNAPLMWPR